MHNLEFYHRAVLNVFNASVSEMNFQNLNINFIYKPLIALDNIAKGITLGKKGRKIILIAYYLCFGTLKEAIFFL